MQILSAEIEVEDDDYFDDIKGDNQEGQNSIVKVDCEDYNLIEEFPYVLYINNNNNNNDNDDNQHDHDNNNDINYFWLEFDDLAQLSWRLSMLNQHWAYFF